MAPHVSVLVVLFVVMPRYSAKSRSYYAQRAMERRLLNRVRHPFADQARVYLPRGQQKGLGITPGALYKDVTPEEQAIRRSLGWRGRGLYRGRGGFFGGLAGLLSGQGWKAGSDMGDRLWEAGGKQLAGYIPGLGEAVSMGDKFAGVGQQLASMAGHGLYRGKGAYSTNNLITDEGASNIVPAFHPTDLHEIVYSNREYVRDIYAPAANAAPFAVDYWALNPGLPDSFPWLSQLAINFEEYELLQLAYTYKSTVADFASSSGQVGQVVMCTQYNPNSDVFADKEEMMLYEGGMSCKTTDSLIHGIECDPSKIAGAPSKYVRVGNLPPTEDLKNYDLGRTSIAVLNAPATYAGQQLGELWVSYTIRLRKPKFSSGNAYNVRRDMYCIPQTTLTTAGVMPSSAQLISCSRNSMGCSVTPNLTQLSVTTGAGTDNLLLPSFTQNANTQQLMFTIKFPNSYSGIVRIRVLSYDYSANRNATYAISSLAPSTILRFKDIPLAWTIGSGGAASGSPSWSHIMSTYAEAGGNVAAQTDCELHLRILPATNGITNSIQFGLGSFGANADIIAFPQIEIAQYNSFLSIQDNGSNDQLSLITASGASYVWA